MISASLLLRKKFRLAFAWLAIDPSLEARDQTLGSPIATNESVTASRKVTEEASTGTDVSTVVQAFHTHLRLGALDGFRRLSGKEEAPLRTPLRVPVTNGAGSVGGGIPWGGGLPL
jgi:hypothetical protein